jgi:hypothetical protein
MEFEEMKKIWDSQNNKPMYVIDEKSLHDVVKRKINAMARKVNLFDYGMIAITMFVGVFMIIDGIKSNYQWTDFLTAVAAFGITIYVVINRSRRRKLELKFGQSLVDGLDNAIVKIDYLIKQGKTFVFWYVIPFALVTVISMASKPNSIWSWLLIIAAFTFASWLGTWEVRKFHIPKKRSLEGLRKTLTQDLEDQV